MKRGLLQLCLLAACSVFLYYSSNLFPQQNMDMALYDYESNVDEIEETGKERDYYTIVVSTYHRDDKLAMHLEHWLSCPALYQVQVVWHDPTREIPGMLQDVVEDFNCT